uniref:Uncharacterized protein n=1 Tax=Trichogramma kaykai TaxID=54128 RepID=A0ABD2W9I7_9HYME
MRDARVVRQRRASSTAVCECKATATAKVLKDNPNEMIQLKGHVPSCPLEDNAVRIARFKETLRVAAIADFCAPRELYDRYALLDPEAAAFVFERKSKYLGVAQIIFST